MTEGKCDNCIHNSLCNRYGYISPDGHINYYNKGICKSYSDKSEWEHLPCKVGDVIYEIDDIACQEDCGECGFYYPGGMGDSPECLDGECGRKVKECCKVKKITVTDKKDIFGWLSLDAFGQWVFLNPSEAEAALKERLK